MPSKPEHLYEYAVVRYVPSIEREEFVNIGLIMMCKRRRWVRMAWTLSGPRIQAFCPNEIRDHVAHQLEAFEAVAHGRADALPMGTLPAEERFRWLTAVRSACLQTSRPHPGLIDDLDATFDRLYAEQVTN